MPPNVLADLDPDRTLALISPLTNRGHRYAEVVGQVVDVHELLRSRRGSGTRHHSTDPVTAWEPAVRERSRSAATRTMRYLSASCDADRDPTRSLNRSSSK